MTSPPPLSPSLLQLSTHSATAHTLHPAAPPDQRTPTACAIAPDHTSPALQSPAALQFPPIAQPQEATVAAATEQDEVQTAAHSPTDSKTEHPQTSVSRKRSSLLAHPPLHHHLTLSLTQIADLSLSPNSLLTLTNIAMATTPPCIALGVRDMLLFALESSDILPPPHHRGREVGRDGHTPAAMRGHWYEQEEGEESKFLS